MKLSVASAINASDTVVCLTDSSESLNTATIAEQRWIKRKKTRCKNGFISQNRVQSDYEFRLFFLRAILLVDKKNSEREVKQVAS